MLTLKKWKSLLAQGVSFFFNFKKIEEILDKEGFKILLQKAEAGDAEAQKHVGILYCKGLMRTEPDISKALYWLELSAQQGNSKAQFYLGHLYQTGSALGVEQNTQKAFGFYLLSAQQDEPSSQVQVAFSYLEGKGVEKDLKQAVYWYEKAAAQGDKYAQYYLANTYQFGIGVESDYKKAFELNWQSAEQGLALAQFQVGYFYEKGLGVKQDYKKACEWTEKAAFQNYPQAYHQLAYYYSHGLGVEKNEVKAFDLIKKGAELGLIQSQLWVAESYYNGTNNILPNMQQAAYWYEKAAEQGDKTAQLAIATCYEKGLGVEVDAEKAQAWKEKALAQGFQPPTEETIGE